MKEAIKAQKYIFLAMVVIFAFAISNNDWIKRGIENCIIHPSSGFLVVYNTEKQKTKCLEEKIK